MFFTAAISTKTNITILIGVPFAIVDTCDKQLVVTVNTKKHLFFD